MMELKEKYYLEGHEPKQPKTQVENGENGFDMEKVIKLTKNIRRTISTIHYYLSPADRENVLKIIDRIESEVLNGNNGNGQTGINDFGKAIAKLRSTFIVIGNKPNPDDMNKLFNAINNFNKALSQIKFEKKGIKTTESWVDSETQEEELEVGEVTDFT